ncbi:MAG: hypothetical protein E7376_00975 [Clostridiales bacterium]|nr:hypothetical protein [Clostridiales bacterium]
MDKNDKQINSMKKRIEKEIKSHNKYVARQTAKFLKKIGFNKYDTIESLNAKTLEFARQAKREELWQIYLLDEQKNDAAFMLKLLKSNDNMLDKYHHCDSFSEELKKNTDFMIEYIKLLHAKMLEKYPSGYYFMKYTLLYNILNNNKEVLKNIDLIIKLANEFPNENILEYVAEHNYTYSYVYEQKFLNLTLREEFVKQQVAKFGADALKYIPNNLENYLDYVSLAIEKSGFKALKYLPINQVLANKKLIVKAFNASGKNKEQLREFIEKTCSPYRERHYMCHCEPHYSSWYDEKYKEVQTKLQKSKVINQLFATTTQEEITK